VEIRGYQTINQAQITEEEKNPHSIKNKRKWVKFR
jgi:hypothetical protein